MSAHIPKAVLYYNPGAVWPSAALLALEEKGYDDGEVELKIVDIGKAENLSLSFLRLNSKGTLPTLVVPLEKTLAPEDDHRYKAVTNTKAVLEFLDRSRSAISRTHTISSAPAPALAPATIALSSTASAIIDLLHSEAIDQNSLFLYNYVSDAALAQSKQPYLVFLNGRLEAINAYLAANQTAQIQTSEKTRKLWEAKKAQTETLLTVYSVADKDDAALTPDEKAAREGFRATSHDLWSVRLRKALTSLDNEMIGPFALGDQISIADLHLGPWFARIAHLSGCLASDDGDAVVQKIEARIALGGDDDDFTLPRNFQAIVSPDLTADPSLEITPGAKRAKLAAFWDEMTTRPSWKKVYGDKLH